ncbi:MAG: SDR family NAD(P)-dependent oxidoreductase, partial [Flavisolibacter sp.]|nr:SDR family NAD(P)-dependent oxidoreductase [Flavisolibacter sp.]
MNRLENKVAIITGAAQGMGASHARTFVAEGAKVVLTDLNEKAGKSLADELGENALFMKHDVTKAEEWANVVKKTEDKFGPVTVLVNNAGVLGPIAKTADLDYDEYLKVIAVNQHAPFLGMKAVIPSMLKAGMG